MGNDKAFLKVNMRLIRTLGSDEAVLYAFLCFVSKYRKKDDQGYCVIDTEYIRTHLGWAKKTIIKRRDTLVKVGLLRFKQGVNQNIKNKYRVVT
jgi:hypothetical protein